MKNQTHDPHPQKKMKGPALLKPGSSKAVNLSPDTLPESENTY